MASQSWWGAELLASGPPDAPWATARRQVTFGQLRSEVSGLARTLGLSGIRPGATVATRGVPSYTQVWTILALWSLGAQAQLVDFRLRGPELAGLLRMCAPQFLITIGAGLRPGRDAFLDECEVLVRPLAAGRPASTSHCVIQFTSGTTGKPKAVGRTPESLLVELARWRGLDGMPAAGERVAVLEPVTHSFGLIGGLLCAMDAGATVVFPHALSPRATASAAARSQLVLGNPRQFAELAATEGPVPPHGLRLAVSGGDVLPQDVADAFHRVHGIPVGQAYGTTETGVIAASLTGGERSTVIGLPLPGVKTRVSGGILEVHVPQSPYPYEAEPWNGGWMPTGDLVDRDPRSGMLRLRGRADDAGRTDLDTIELEAALRGHALVSDAVVLGTEPAEAYVESQSDISAEELRSWCDRLAGASIPATYHVLRQLPRTANGKALRVRVPPPDPERTRSQPPQSRRRKR